MTHCTISEYSTTELHLTPEIEIKVESKREMENNKREEEYEEKSNEESDWSMEE